MATILRILHMPLHEVAILVKDLLRKFRRDLFGIDLFDIAGTPTPATQNVIPVPSTAVRQFLPATKLPLIETTLLRIHRELAFRDHGSPIATLIPIRFPR